MRNALPYEVLTTRIREQPSGAANWRSYPGDASITADVVLKERRRLVLMVREAPFNLIHLRNMATITEAGGTLFPPVPAFYSRPNTIEDLVDHSVGRALDQFGIHSDVFPRWDDDLRRALIRQGPAD